MAENLPSIETLRLLLRCEPETGRLFWRDRPVSMFSDSGRGAASSAKAWNAKNAGKEAFTASNAYGYRVGAVFGKIYGAHRVLWALHHGARPADQLDHINGVRDDNRLVNLREATQAENMRNIARPKDNKSGVMGVHRCARTRKWVAQICVGGNRICLGRFADRKAAELARSLAEARYGFHENHGRVAA